MKDFKWQKYSLEYLIIYYKLTKQEYYKEKPFAIQRREMFISRLAEENSRLSNLSAERWKKNLPHMEKQRRQAERIKKAVQLERVGSVSRVSKINTYGNTEEYNSKKEIEEIIMKYSEWDYLQPFNTPFLNGSLYKDLGAAGHKNTVRQILEGTYEIKEDLDIYTKLYIKQLKLPTGKEINKSMKPITLEEHKAQLKKMKEKASSNPPLYNGLWKANALNNNIAKIDITFRNLALIQ